MVGASWKQALPHFSAQVIRLRPPSRSLSLKHQQHTTLRFAAEATDAYGLGRLRLVVTSASGLRIERESVLQVQPPVPQERDIRRVKLDPAGSYRVDPAWLSKYYPASANVSLTVSNKPPLNINRLVKGLPVIGVMLSMYWPRTGATHLPPMKLS